MEFEKRMPYIINNAKTLNKTSVMKAVKKIFVATLVVFGLASCGGHGLCDAYSAMKFDKEKTTISADVIEVEHIENGTI